MKKIKYNKLVRDLIPSNIKSKGSKFLVRKLDPKSFAKELKKKLIEESMEVGEAKTTDEITREIGDLQDIIDELTDSYGIKPIEITKSRKLNMQKKGGFKKKIFLVWAEEGDYKKPKGK